MWPEKRKYDIGIKTWKMTETLAHGYSSDSTQWELLNEYQHDRVTMIFKNLYVLVLWTKVASALEGLRSSQAAMLENPRPREVWCISQPRAADQRLWDAWEPRSLGFSNTAAWRGLNDYHEKIYFSVKFLGKVPLTSEKGNMIQYQQKCWSTGFATWLWW